MELIFLACQNTYLELKTVKNFIFTIFGIMTMTKKVYDKGLTHFRGFAQGQHFTKKVVYFSKVYFFNFYSIIYFFIIFLSWFKLILSAEKPRSNIIYDIH